MGHSETDSFGMCYTEFDRFGDVKILSLLIIPNLVDSVQGYAESAKFGTRVPKLLDSVCRI